jgi:predicted esterase
MTTMLPIALSFLLMTAEAFPDGEAIPRRIADFFHTDDVAGRERIAAEIEADPAYDRSRVSEWLHSAALFEPADPGLLRISVNLSNGAARDVLVRVPAGYEPGRPWPTLFALHGTGGDAAGVVRFYERLLGSRVDEFVIAAPDQYEEMIVYHANWPPVGEHAAIRAAVKRRFHVDSDRVYVSGYSKGGHTTWMQMLLHADQFAGGVALAGTFVMPEPEHLWETILPNLANTRMLCVWGETDDKEPGGRTSAHGGIAGLNRQIQAIGARLALPLEMDELPGVGHGGVRPTDEALWRALEARRSHYPAEFRHVFRHEYQAAAYWVEGHSWVGTQWTDKVPQVSFQRDENPNRREDVAAAFGRAYRGALGELRGKIDGQVISVRRKRIGDLTVWIGASMIAWDEPITLKVSGRKLFDGSIDASLYVCLSQAARIYDFDRLRWAGIRVRGTSRGRIVDADTEFPDPLKHP